MNPLVLSSLLIFFLHLTGSGQLELSVSNIDPAEGELYIAVYDNEKAFLNADEAVLVEKIAVQAATESLTLPALAEGEYAISIFHDLNGNARLDLNAMGIPQEPYGFSNNAMGRFGPPKFKQAKFKLEGDMKIEVKLAGNTKTRNAQ